MSMTLTNRLRAACSRLITQPNTAGRGTCVSDAVTINGFRGKIVTESKAIAAAGTYTITLTNNQIALGDYVVLVMNIGGGTGTAVITAITISANTLAITVKNTHATDAFNSAHLIEFAVMKHP